MRRTVFREGWVSASGRMGLGQGNNAGTKRGGGGGCARGTTSGSEGKKGEVRVVGWRL